MSRPIDRNIALIFAGGTGSRMGATNLPKQFLMLGGKSIIAHTIDHFEYHELIDKVVVVCVDGWIEHLNKIISDNHFKKITAVVKGGTTGQESIYNGLRAIERNCSINQGSVVLIHDGVRPLIDKETITDCINSVRTHGCTATVAPAVETIIEEEQGKVARVVDRSRCKLARAPQGFFFGEIFEAHKRAIAEKELNFTDSISLMSHYGYDIYTINGPSNNIKITTRQDYFAFKGYMDYEEMSQFWD